MVIYSNLKRAFLMLLVGSVVASTGLPAGADMSKDGGKNSAWVSISGVTIPGSTTTIGAVTIAKGKKKHVLEVDAVITETTNIVTAIGIRATVNGFSMEPSTFWGAVEEACSPATSGCTITGRWWIDLDQAELVSPGTFIGQPLVVSVQDASAGGTGTGALSIRARLMKP